MTSQTEITEKLLQMATKAPLECFIVYNTVEPVLTVTWIKRSPLYSGQGAKVPNIFPYKCMHCGLY